MGKTHDDEVYKKGVRDGQRGGFLDDLIMGNISAGNKDGKIYKEGYTYGAQHRYGPEGRYHNWSGSGSNDPKSKEIRKSEKTSTRSYKNSGGSFDYEDRHYTTRDSNTTYYRKTTPRLVKWVVSLAILGVVSSPFLSYTIKRYFPSSEVKKAWNLEYMMKYGKDYERYIAADKLKEYGKKYDNHPYIKSVRAKRKEKLTQMWNKKVSLEYLSKFQNQEARKKAEQWLITYYDAIYGANCKDLAPGVRHRCHAVVNQLKFQGKTKPSGVMY